MFLMFLQRQLRRAPTLEELLDLYNRLHPGGQPLTPEDAWFIFFGEYHVEFVWFSVVAAGENFDEAWAATIGDRSPEAYARAFRAFQTWLAEDGIYNFVEPLDMLMTFKRFLEGNASTLELVLTAAPSISNSTARHLDDLLSSSRRTDDLLEAGADGQRAGDDVLSESAGDLLPSGTELSPRILSANGEDVPIAVRTYDGQYDELTA